MTAPFQSIGARLGSAIPRQSPIILGPGIVFKDITPLVRRRGPCFGRRVTPWRPHSLRADVTHVVAIESRGFLFRRTRRRFAFRRGGSYPSERPGKLPFRTSREDYELEYGSDALEMHVDAFNGARRGVLGRRRRAGRREGRQPATSAAHRAIRRPGHRASAFLNRAHLFCNGAPGARRPTRPSA